MCGVTKESIGIALMKWRSYILILIGTLCIPLSWSVTISHNPSIFLENMFYSFFIEGSLSVYARDVNFLSMINLILVIVPSVYFTYRRISKFENESIVGLGVVIFILTLIVLAIVSSWSFVTPYQIDNMPSPTPNLQYLPGFALLLLFLSVVLPILSESKQVREVEWRGIYGTRGWIKKRLPHSPFGWLAALFFILPTQGIIHSTGRIISGFEFIAPFSSSMISYSRFGDFSSYNFTLIFGGTVTAYLLIFSFLWSAILVVFTYLYLHERIHRRLLVLAGIVSLIPNFIYMATSILMQLLNLSSQPFIILLPLLHIGVLLILKNENQKSVILTSDGRNIRKSEFVKVPITYMFRSLMKRVMSGVRRENEGVTSHTEEFRIEEEIP